ncbi:glycosyltransferase family 4 protein [Desulfovibrio legallii]|uniref:glycosyltransferase family 4 protein n=1 Tax=Desulfovibrio legallii TaxID=571438 RepID=UPI000E4C71F4|nr:glycosyltransferase family 1 protein [Desulfovibrio legallii]RHH22434.1 glycosyltransferase family 1 protein [Desulfovibrio sp. AM18-2]
MRTLAIDCRMARMSGIGVYLRNVAPRCMALLADAVRFRLLGYDGAFPVPDGVSWEPVSFDAPIYSITEQYRMLPLLRGCDALWLPHYPIPVLAGIPLVVTVHDVTHLALPGLFTGIQKMYARLMFQAVRHKAAELLFVSEFSRQEFLRLVGRPRGGATVTPNGVDASWLECPLVDAPTQPPYFLAVGNIKPHKNIRLLCHTFAGIAGQCTANLVLAGAYTGFRSAETSTEALAAICPGRIHFTGALEQTELVHLMRGATALVFPSRYEGFGLPPLEALAVGVPVVASDIPPVREVCGTHAQYFSPDSEGQLAQAMLQVLALPPQERRQHAAAGRAHAHTFSWARAAETTAQVLQKTLHL